MCVWARAKLMSSAALYPTPEQTQVLAGTAQMDTLTLHPFKRERGIDGEGTETQTQIKGIRLKQLLQFIPKKQWVAYFLSNKTTI